MITLTARVINPSCRRSRRLPRENSQGGEQKEMDGAASGMAREEESEPGGEEKKRQGGTRCWSKTREH